MSIDKKWINAFCKNHTRDHTTVKMNVLQLDAMTQTYLLKCNVERIKASFRILHTVCYYIYKAQTKKIEILHWHRMHICVLKLFLKTESYWLLSDEEK